MYCDILALFLAFLNLFFCSYVWNRKKQIEKENKYMIEDLIECQRLIFKYGGFNEFTEYTREKRAERGWWH